eukprot:1963104-Amphidinium_carterae.1
MPSVKWRIEVKAAAHEVDIILAWNGMRCQALAKGDIRNLGYLLTSNKMKLVKDHAVLLV